MRSLALPPYTRVETGDLFVTRAERGKTTQWYDVRQTGVRLRTKEEALPSIEHYFQRTHFSEITEMVAFIIHLSTDASMAWVIGEMRVRATQEVSEEKERDFSFRCAWVSIYEKHEGKWAQVVDASSFQFQTDEQESSI